MIKKLFKDALVGAAELIAVFIIIMLAFTAFADQIIPAC